MGTDSYTVRKDMGTDSFTDGKTWGQTFIQMDIHFYRQTDRQTKTKSREEG